MAGDRLGEARGAAVGQVVAGHGGDHREAEAHPLDGLGDPLGLAGVERLGVPGVDQAEPARPGAALAVDHEGGRAVLAPALVDVRAAGLLAHGDEAEVAHRVLEPEVGGVGAERRAQPVGLARGDLEPSVTPAWARRPLQPDGDPVAGRTGRLHGPTRRRDRLAGALAAAERRQVVGPVAPHDVAPVDGRLAVAPAAPQRRGPRRHRVGDVAQADVDPLVGQRGHPLVGDPARHDVAPVAHVGRHVEGEPVHGPAPGEAHADGRDLARVVAVGVDPDARVLAQPAGPGQADVGQRVDEELFDRAHVGDGVGQPVLPAAPLGRKRHDRVADELARPVVGDVATPVGAHQVGPDVGGWHEDVAHVGPHAQRVDVRVLEQQQVIVGRAGVKGPLQGPRLAVGHLAEPPRAERHGAEPRVGWLTPARPPSRGSRGSP